MSFTAYNNANWHPQTASPQKDNSLIKTGQRPSHKRQYKKCTSACSNCRRRRVKCDRILPCSSCCTKGIHEDCMFTFNPNTDKPALLSNELQRLRQENEGIIALLLENEMLKAQLQDSPNPLFSPITSVKFDSRGTAISTQVLPSSTTRVTTPSDQQQPLLVHKPSSLENLSDVHLPIFAKTRGKSSARYTGAGSLPKSETSKILEFVERGTAESQDPHTYEKPKNNEKTRQIGRSQDSSNQVAKAAKITIESDTKPSWSTAIALDSIARTGSCSVRVIKVNSLHGVNSVEKQRFKGKTELGQEPISMANTAYFEQDYIMPNNSICNSLASSGSSASFNSDDSNDPQSPSSFECPSRVFVENSGLPPPMQCAFPDYDNISINCMMTPVMNSSSSMTAADYCQSSYSRYPYCNSDALASYNFGGYENLQLPNGSLPFLSHSGLYDNNDLPMPPSLGWIPKYGE